MDRGSAVARQLAAIRRSMAGAPPTGLQMAAVSGLNPSWLREVISQEDWPRFDFRRRVVRDAWDGGVADTFAAMGEGVPGEEGREVSDEALPAPAGAGEAGAADTAPDGAGDAEPLGARLRRTVGALLDEMDVGSAGSGRRRARFDKTQIDMLWTVIRALDKAERMLPRAGEGAAAGESPAERSRRAAEVLKRIDDRIFELAHAFARQMFNEWRESGGPDGGDGHEGLAGGAGNPSADANR